MCPTFSFLRAFAHTIPFVWNSHLRASRGSSLSFRYQMTSHLFRKVITLSNPQSQLFSITLSTLEVFPQRAQENICNMYTQQRAHIKIHKLLSKSIRQTQQKNGQKIQRYFTRGYPKLPINIKKTVFKLVKRECQLKLQNTTICSLERV